MSKAPESTICTTVHMYCHHVSPVGASGDDNMMRLNRAIKLLPKVFSSAAIEAVGILATSGQE